MTIIIIIMIIIVMIIIVMIIIVMIIINGVGGSKQDGGSNSKRTSRA